MANPGIRLDEIRLVCEEPSCTLSTGGFGFTTEGLLERLRRLQPAVVPKAPTVDPPPPASDALPKELVELDPEDDGIDCPFCAEASPKRDGKLLALPAAGPDGGGLEAAAGWAGLGAWQLVESSLRGTLRVLDALRTVGDGKPRVKPKGFVIGRKALTLVVIHALPFDGHLLRMGNRDNLLPPRKGKTVATVEPRYGIEQGPAMATSRTHPLYVRELQEDLLWLGYFARSRGSPPIGEFTYHVLGSVLAFKQDLVEIYRIPHASTRAAVAPGSIEAGKFDLPIHYQKAFVPPVQMVSRWAHAGDAAKDQLVALANGLEKVERAKNDEAHDKHLSGATSLLAQLEFWADGHWPHQAAFEDITAPFLPFDGGTPTKTVDELAIPSGATSKYASRGSMLKDAVFAEKLSLFGAQAGKGAGFRDDCETLLGAIATARDQIAEIDGRLGRISPPASKLAAWLTVSTRIATMTVRVRKLLDMTEFWVLDCPRHIEAWLEHLVEMGTVDQPTAVYLKALREGAQIGPDHRPGYHLLVDPPDVANKDEGCKYIRRRCLERPPNTSGRKATTAPESLLLQILANESGGTFTTTIRNLNTTPGDNRHHVILGIDVNTQPAGAFDAVHHQGGDWYVGRGWGIGQMTIGNGELDKIPLKRGLPIMSPGAATIVHPRALSDIDTSFDEVVDDRLLAKYNARGLRRDCSFDKVLDGAKYDCQRCLARFYKDGFLERPLTADKPDPDESQDDDPPAKGKKPKKRKPDKRPSVTHGLGGVFVPVHERERFGTMSGADRFFVDFERYTEYARAEGATEDPGAVDLYDEYFGLKLELAPAHVAAVLRRGVASVKKLEKGKKSIDVLAAEVAESVGVSAAEIALDVRAHIAARSEWPCSWMRTRIGYSGSGQQAFSSMHDLLRVVGAGVGDPVVERHIAEASALRRGS